MARTKVSLQYAYKIAIQCIWSKTHWKIVSFDGHVLFDNVVLK